MKFIANQYLHVFFATDVYFMKIQHKQCKSAKFKDDLLDIYYQDLSEAMDVCRNLSNCAGVYDQDCDDKGLYKLCPKGSIHRAILPSCAHYKFGNFF